MGLYSDLFRRTHGRQNKDFMENFAFFRPPWSSGGISFEELTPWQSKDFLLEYRPMEEINTSHIVSHYSIVTVGETDKSDCSVATFKNELISEMS